jgi:dihydrofolate reductase
MRRVVISEFVSLDGVFEDPHLWSFDFFGDDWVQWKLKELREHDALLLGRTTYDAFAESWPSRTDEIGFADRINNMPKYVVTGSDDGLIWKNTTALHGDLAEAVRAIKEEPGQDILVNGSGQLVEALKALDLVDEYRLMIYPVVVGSGRRFFADGTAKQKLTLVETIPFASGPVVLVHRPLRD